MSNGSTSNTENASVKDGSYNNYITENYGSIENYDFGFPSGEDDDGEDWKSRPLPPLPQESESEWDTRRGPYPGPPDDNFLIPNAWIRNRSQDTLPARRSWVAGSES
ncbi:hypothetical protein Moror_8617 [Moniliophthora roreri MCA 2997]|uniref:Uncharacterized protein n=1 Tax=Moniliophthora roreri (strain MCA 2997) TaxID=1381753 RepID=V2XA50_MONRO|nr:hypothetical protein Moror_8617 [Moniliophthora roreri MCA 2997]